MATAEHATVKVNQADRDLVKRLLCDTTETELRNLIDKGLAHTAEVEWCAQHRIDGGRDDPDRIRRAASCLANIRQGRSSPPRCEPPGDCDIRIAEKHVRDVLAALALTT